MDTFITTTGQRLVGVHDPSACAGRHCVIHNPSNHAMAAWPTFWREDRSIMERICKHGVGHPDPDDVAYHATLGQDIGVHGCDGCCGRAGISQALET